ncbi:SRPBCC family protein [Mobilicoccus massiliensis]|uniref:SRPBCC family protein n=1 Tax=Mobilicoccus massiliensis TaxID=1522310 RepID=UPI0005905C64|nr:SRPBCC family protein [Mobilicoccus massiliensis]
MPSRTEESIRIDAPPGEVLDVVADVESYPEWSAGMREVTVLTEDEESWPLQVEFLVDAGFSSERYTLDYTWDVDVDGAGTVSWTLARSDALKALDGSYVIAPDGDGTLVTYTMSVETAMKVPGMLRRKAEQKIVSTALTGLKQRVEG